MMMVVDVTEFDYLDSLQQELMDVGQKLGVTINLQREEIFQMMHRV